MHVLLISFGIEAWARAWLEDTGVSFPLLLDQERRVYRTYDLDHSIARVWNLNTLWYYVRALLAGRELHPIKGDPHQLGGNFLIDGDGRIRFAHRSREPTDRPSVDELVEVVTS